MCPGLTLKINSIRNTLKGNGIPVIDLIDHMTNRLPTVTRLCVRLCIVVQQVNSIDKTLSHTYIYASNLP
jgi:hypothetical protein